MPLCGFICDATDMPVPIDACLACARSGALPGCHQTAPVIAGIVRGLRPDDPAALLRAGFGLTVTTLIGCVRKARLMRETPYWLKPAQSYWAYRGTLDAWRRGAVCRRSRSDHRGETLRDDS